MAWMPAGCTAAAPAVTEGEEPQVGRVQAVGVLGGIDGGNGLVEVEARGDGVLDQVAVDGRVGVELVDRGEQIGLRSGRRGCGRRSTRSRSVRRPHASWRRSRRWRGRRRPGWCRAQRSARPPPAWRPARSRPRRRRRPRARPASAASRSVPELAFAGKHHGQPVLIGGGDDLVVPDRPPGWITAATPAAATASRPSRNGKKASLAAAPPLARPAARAAAISPGVTRFCWPPPIPTAMPSAARTMALDLTQAHTRQASSMSRHCRPSAGRLVTTRQSSRPAANATGPAPASRR